METGKFEPEGATFQWETRLAEFPTGAVDPKVGIFLLSLKIRDRFFFSHAIKKIVPFPLIAHMEMQKQNEEK